MVLARLWPTNCVGWSALLTRPSPVLAAAAKTKNQLAINKVSKKKRKSAMRIQRNKGKRNKSRGWVDGSRWR